MNKGGSWNWYVSIIIWEKILFKVFLEVIVTWKVSLSPNACCCVVVEPNEILFFSGQRLDEVQEEMEKALMPDRRLELMMWDRGLEEAQVMPNKH